MTARSYSVEPSWGHLRESGPLPGSRVYQSLKSSAASVRQAWMMVVNHGVEDRFIDATRARLFHDFSALNSLLLSISKQFIGRFARRDDVSAYELRHVVDEPAFQELFSTNAHNRQFRIGRQVPAETRDSTPLIRFEGKRTCPLAKLPMRRERSIVHQPTNYLSVFRLGPAVEPQAPSPRSLDRWYWGSHLSGTRWVTEGHPTNG